MKGQRAKLDQIEFGEMMKADHFKYAIPMFGTDGMQARSQWRAWKRLQRLGLAEIEGSGEADDLVLTDAGKDRLRKIFIDQFKKGP